MAVLDLLAFVEQEADASAGHHHETNEYEHMVFDEAPNVSKRRVAARRRNMATFPALTLL